MNETQKDTVMKEFFVFCREACPECRGARVVGNPRWVRFFEETGGHGDENAWARENGFDCALDMGSEEEPCERCEGTGVIEEMVPLRDALAALRSDASSIA